MYGHPHDFSARTLAIGPVHRLPVNTPGRDHAITGDGTGVAHVVALVLSKHLATTSYRDFFILYDREHCGTTHPRNSDGLDSERRLLRAFLQRTMLIGCYLLLISNSFTRRIVHHEATLAPDQTCVCT